MHEYRKVEIIVGLFVCVGIVAIAGLAVKLGQVGGFSSSGYPLEATFSDAGGVRVGGDVMLAGVSIGRITEVTLQESIKAHLVLEIN
ncbi:MAG: MlaD family protein [Mariprofundaceae bacterium]|nr:MlaD family protein [Mariprofundaceae bacterium]